MPKCDKCGNEYDKCFVIKWNDREYTFDSFECAISMIAPRCDHCQCLIIGHGVENEKGMYCCVHCAQEMGETKLADRV